MSGWGHTVFCSPKSGVSSVSHSKHNHSGVSSAQTVTHCPKSQLPCNLPSLALKQSEKNQTKKIPKAEALPYFQQKEESITQGNLPCRLWLCRSLHCCRNICVTALLMLLGSYPCGATSHCSQRGQILGSSSPLWPELPQTLRCHGKSHTIFWVGSRDPVLPS